MSSNQIISSTDNKEFSKLNMDFQMIKVRSANLVDLFLMIHLNRSIRK